MIHLDIINIGLAFVEGFALIISPCILPILPIILSGSLTGKKSRPIGIVVGFIIVFSIVTLFSRVLIQLAHVSEDTIRTISFGILLILGIMMISTYLTEKFNVLTQRLTNVGHSLQSANNPQSGFLGGLLFGGLVGVIWTPCAGPILAAVIVQVVVQQTTFSSTLVVISFAIGAGLPMLLIALVGRRIMTTFTFFREKTVLFRQLLGFIIILTVLYLIFFPGTGSSFSPSSSKVISQPTALIQGLEHPYQAPELAGIDTWINSTPLNWHDLKGKVVLIDFWTYSCINCIRTLPYLKDWYAKYHDRGLEIIGVHSPEFQFEHDVNNVKRAVAAFGIHYPVALDNRFLTWQNFKNEYWPAHYLVNQSGHVVYMHFGEGEYDVTENNIRYLLGVRSRGSVPSAEENYSTAQTPETYLGYYRLTRFLSPEPIIKNQPAYYTYPKTLSENQWALNGKWIISADKIVSAAPNASIRIRFMAGKVYAVMGTSHSDTVSILLDGKPIAVNHGSDVIDSQVVVKHNQLYSLVDLKKGHSGMLEITAASQGLEVYTFTFGNESVY